MSLLTGWTLRQNQAQGATAIYHNWGVNTGKCVQYYAKVLKCPSFLHILERKLVIGGNMYVNKVYKAKTQYFTILMRYEHTASVRRRIHDWYCSVVNKTCCQGGFSIISLGTNKVLILIQSTVDWSTKEPDTFFRTSIKSFLDVFIHVLKHWHCSPAVVLFFLSFLPRNGYSFCVFETGQQ